MSKLDKQVDSLPFGLHEVKAKGDGNCDICGDFIEKGADILIDKDERFKIPGIVCGKCKKRRKVDGHN